MYTSVVKPNEYRFFLGLFVPTPKEQTEKACHAIICSWHRQMADIHNIIQQ